MKTYRIKTQFTFTGEFYVKADSKEEAKEIVDNDCGMTYGAITSTAEDENIDWEFDMTPNKKITSVTLKPKKKKS